MTRPASLPVTVNGVAAIFHHESTEPVETRQSVWFSTMCVATFRGTGVWIPRNVPEVTGSDASAVRLTALSWSIPVKAPGAIAVRVARSGVGVEVP